MSNTSIQGSVSSMQQMGNVHQTYTKSQKNEVAAILAEYDSSSLTEEDALTINEAFRDAGLKRGPELRQAIEDAGFDAELLGSLAPPPPEGPPPGEGPVAVDITALSALQEILANYDLSNLTSDQENEIINRIQSSSADLKGLLINRQA